MNTLDSGWLVKQFARVVDAPTSTHTVITHGLNSETSKCYVKEVESHLSETTERALTISRHSASKLAE